MLQQSMQLFIILAMEKLYMEWHFWINLGPNSLSNLLAAISTAVTVAEILKNNGFAVEESKNFAFFHYQTCMQLHCDNLNMAL